MTNSFALDDKYTLAQGTILLSGVQALVRLPLDQHRADQRAPGSDTAGLISGYRGSPLAGLDSLLQHSRRLLASAPDPIHSRRERGSGRHDDLRQPDRQPVPDSRSTMAWLASGTARRRASTARRRLQARQPRRRRPHGGVLVLAGDDPAVKVVDAAVCLRGCAVRRAACRCSIPATCRRCSISGCSAFALSRYSGPVGRLQDRRQRGRRSWHRRRLGRSALRDLPARFESDGKPWQPTQTADARARRTSLALEQDSLRGPAR